MINTKNDNFASLAASKTEFMRRLVNDDDLVRSILSTDRDFKNFVITDEARQSIIWNNIFPCSYIVDTIQDTKSFITMAFRYTPSDKPRIWKISNVSFYIFCHKNIVATDYGILRYDFMLQRVDSIMSDSRFESWYNRLEFNGAEDVIMDDKGNYVGVRANYMSREKNMGTC